MTSKTIAKLRDPEYRSSFVASQINIGVPFQIRALMRARGWTQGQLAERAEMLQPRISGLLKPGKVRPNIETLRRLAEAFDCGLMVRFASFEELTKWSEEFDPESFNVPAFAAESVEDTTREIDEQSVIGRGFNGAEHVTAASQWRGRVPYNQSIERPAHLPWSNTPSPMLSRPLQENRPCK